MVYRGTVPPIRRQEIAWLGSGTRQQADEWTSKRGMRVISLPLADQLKRAKDKKLKDSFYVEPFLAYPKQNGVFTFEQDLRDPHFGYFLRWSSIEAHMGNFKIEQLKRPKKGLLIIPRSIDWTNKAITPASITVINNFIQASHMGELEPRGFGVYTSGWGRFDPEHSIAVEATEAELAKLPFDQQRMLCREENFRLVHLIYALHGAFGRFDLQADHQCESSIGIVGVYDVDERGRQIETPSQ